MSPPYRPRFKSIGFYLAILVILGVPGLAHSVTGPGSTDSVSRPSHVTVAIGSNSIPYYYLDDRKEPVGLVVDIWKLWSQKTGIKVIFKSYSFGDSVKAVADGRAEIQGGCFFSKQRDTYLDFVAPVATVQTNFFYKRTIFGIRSLNDLRGFRIGVIEGDYAIEYLKKEMPQASLAIYPNNKALFSAIASGDVVAFVKDTAIALANLAKLGIVYQFRYFPGKPLYEQKWLCAVRQGNKVLAEIVRRGMARITDRERAVLEQRWTGTTSVKTGDVLIIACPKDYPPLSMLSQSGKPSGMLVDFWNLWARKTGRKVKFRFSTWEESLAALKNGSADIHSGLFHSLAREQFLDFSPPYYQIESGFFYHLGKKAPRNLTSLNGKKVGSIAGSMQLAYLREKYPKMRAVPLPVNEALVIQTQQGTIDAFLSELPVVMNLLERRGERGAFGLLPGGRFTRQLHAAVAKGNRKLLKTVTAGLKDLTEQELVEIESRWISDPSLRQLGLGTRLPPLSKEERAWLAAKKIVLIAGESDWPPLDFADQTGHYKGVAADYLKLFGKRLGLRFEIITDYTWSQMIQMVKARKVDGIACIAKRKDREDYLRFSDPYFICPYVIVTGKGYPDISGIGDLIGKRVAIEDGYFLHGKLQKEYPGVTLVPVENTLAALHAVRNHQADAYIGNLMVIKYLLKKKSIRDLKVAAPAPWPGSQLRIGVRKDWPLLVSAINKALATISPREHQHINRRWLDYGPGRTEEAGGLDLGPTDRAWLAGHGTIRLGVDPGWAPFEFIGDDKKYSGMASDYVRWLEENLGVRMKVQEGLTWTQAVEKGRNGGIDIFPCITPTPERAKFLSFTKPYLTFPMAIAARTNFPFIGELSELDGRTVAVCKGYVSHEMLKHHHKGLKLALVDTVEEGLKQLTQGKVEAFVGNLASITYFSKILGLTNIKIAAMTPYSFSLSIGVRKDWPELVRILDKALAAVPDNQRNKIRDSWISMRFEHGVDWGILWRWIVIIVSISAVILSVFLFWNTRLKREVGERKRAEAALTLAHHQLEDKVAQRTEELQLAVKALEAEAHDREAAQETLRKSEEEQRAILETSPNCIVAYDRKGRTVYVNRSFTRIFGWTAEEVIGSHIDFVPQDELALTRQMIRTIYADPDRTHSFETRRLTKDGRTIDVSIHAGVFRDPDDKPMGIIVNIENITDRKTSEKELAAYRESLENLVADRTADLEVAMEQAQEADRLKSAFLATMSHELRTPLNSIIGFTGILLQGLGGELNQEQSKQMGMVKTSAQHLLNLINDVLDISKIEAGQLDVASNKFDFPELLDEVQKALAPLARQKDLDLIVELDPRVGEVVSDERRVKQILINLINNAIKFTDAGQVRVACNIRGNKLETKVVDSGIGFRQEDQERLFLAFQQIETGLSRRYEGTGLGLSVCKRLLDLLGGEISAFSPGPGKGATFSFTLPV